MMTRHGDEIPSVFMILERRKKKKMSVAPSADYLSIEGEGKLRATASLVQQKETKYGPSHLDLEEKLERRAGREKRKEKKTGISFLFRVRK